jgi:hypothetical protein
MLLDRGQLFLVPLKKAHPTNAIESKAPKKKDSFFVSTVPDGAVRIKQQQNSQKLKKK